VIHRVTSSAVRRIVPFLVLIGLLAGCDSGEEPPATTTPPIPTSTSTTVDVELCAEITAETVRWLEDLVAELESVAFEELIDPAAWPEGLADVDERGAELQSRSDAAGCDEGLIRGAVVEAASEMEGDARVVRLLLDLLVPPG
jgi:hypothetical protein